MDVRKRLLRAWNRMSSLKVDEHFLEPYTTRPSDYEAVIFAIGDALVQRYGWSPEAVERLYEEALVHRQELVDYYLRTSGGTALAEGVIEWLAWNWTGSPLRAGRR